MQNCKGVRALHFNVVAIPVYNERRQILDVIESVRKHAVDILVVDDGSTDGTSELLQSVPGIEVIGKSVNEGYGAALRTAFDFAVQRGYRGLVTIDSDGQHEPELIPEFLGRLQCWDIVSGSRFLRAFDVNTEAPKERRRINSLITDQLNARLGLKLTDAFCGFKAYRVSALERLHITDAGYAMPLELWVQAACLKLRIGELAVPLVYLDPNRSFGVHLDKADERLAYYQRAIDAALARARLRHDCGLREAAPSMVGNGA